jgi:prepilin-type N-terminal cleavage/methylation domain-containing protein
MNILKSKFLSQNPRKGFSLVEMMVSIFILSTVLMSMMMAMLLSTKGAIFAKDAGKARQLALEVLENCERARFHADDAIFRNAIAANSKNIAGGNIRATASVRRIAPHAAGELPISADIEVVVRWQGVFAGERTYTMRREVSDSACQNVGERL